MKTVQQCLQLLIITLIGWTIKLSSGEIRVVCYYTNWSVYRPGTAKFNPQNINPYLCTHLVYAFGGFTKESNFKPFDKYQDIEKGGYAKFTGLKTYNKNLKTMLAIGGWNEGSSRFSPMVANAEKRREFVKNSIKFLRQNHFDGLDLDWEYPAFRDGGKSRDRDNYASLVQELREEYERESEKTGRPRLLLTMAVPAGIEYINKGYDVPKLMKYLDWMNILSYDYHSAFEPAVNHHSPLYGLEEESEYNYDSDLNINHTISHYLEAGAISDKLVLGIPTYGRSYTLFNPDATDIGSPADGPGEMGDATRENGYLAYYEICEKIKDSDDWFVEQPNPNAMGPYAYKDNQWVGYDDENIVRKKSEFVAKNKLGGIMFWSIDNDDFRGTCTGKPYPLIEAAKEALMAASGYIVDNVIPAPDKAVKTDSKRKRKRPTSAPKKDEEDDSTERLNNKRRIKINKNKKEADDHVTESPAKTRREKIRNESRRRSTETTSTTTSSSSINRYTTPEPPTTPDAGTDFKCEDEGFFPHPRDCKKYYWCLSSGPSELGIIAHQFTCPSGLYFNKAADSCDYTQNVLCNKKKATAKTTTEIPSTTEAIVTSPVSISSSTRRPQPKTTSTTSRTTFVQSSTVEYEDEYEYEDQVNKEKYDTENSEEDPRVIKELLDLIRKAGGIEELEKQLNHYETNSTSVTAAGSTTPSSFSKSLYQRVLSRTVGKNKETSSRTNNSGGPQFKGSQDSSSKSRRTKPQYTAISRQRQTPERTQQDATVIEEGKNDDYEEEEEEERQQQATSKSHFIPEYKTIIRSRTTTSTTELSPDGNDVTRPLRIEDERQVEKQVVTSKTPEYVTLSRRRPTTTSATAGGDSTTSKYLEIRGRSSTTEETSTATPENVTKQSKTEDINVTVSFRSVPGEEEASKTDTNNVTKKEENDNVLIKSDTQTVYIDSSTTESTKVSDNFSSKNPSRSRFNTKITRPPTNTESTVEHDQTTNRSKSKFVLTQEKSSRVESQKVTTHGNEQVPTERTRSRFTLHEVENQKAKEDNEKASTESTRRRGTMRFGQQANSAQSGGLHYDDGSYHPDLYQERKFRPDIAIEISDLSSLTSADLSIKDGSRGRTHSRRILPKQQTNENVENSQQVRAKEIIKPVQVKDIKTTTASSPKEKTINLPKIQKPNSLFNRRLRPNLAVNETKVTNGPRRVNSENVSENSVTPSVTEKTTVKRRLLKRVKATPRTTASPTTTTFTSIPTTGSTSILTTASTSTTQTTVSTYPPSTTSASPSTTEPTTLSTTDSATSATTARTRLENSNSIIVNNANASVEYDDDVYKTSEEEEENIKLSESNIREASEVNLNSFSDKPRRRIVKKIIDGKSAQLKFNALENLETSSTTEAQPTFRRRTIVKKLPTVTESVPSSSTPAIKKTILNELVTEEIPNNSSQTGRRTVLKRLPTVTTTTMEAVPTRTTKNGRTRKIVRRLKVPASSDQTTSAEASLEDGPEEEVEFKNETLPVETTIRDEEEVTTQLNVDPTTESDILTTIFEDVEITSPQTTTVTTAKSTTSIYYKAKFSRPPFLKQRSRPTTEASTRQISTRSNSKNNVLSRFNTRRKSILVPKDTNKVIATTENVQNVTESEVNVATTTVATNASVTELTTDISESTTLYYDVIPTTQIDLEFATDASTEIEPFDEIKFVTDSILEKELANLIKLYEEQRLASSTTENTAVTDNSAQITNSTLTDNITEIINSTLTDIAADIQNSTATDNSTQAQNATKTKLKPNPLLKTPLQRPKFVPKIKTLKFEESSAGGQNSSNDFVHIIREADSNGTEVNKEDINDEPTAVNGTKINQEPRSATNHPLFAYRFVTTQKQENETEFELSNGSYVNVTEKNKIRTLAEILEIEKSNAAKNNGTRINKFKKILENEAFKTSTTRRPSFKPKNGKRPQIRLNNSTEINKSILAPLEETKDNDSVNSEEDDEAFAEVNDSLTPQEEETEDDVTNTSKESGDEITKKSTLNKRPASILKLRPLTNRNRSDSSRESTDEDFDKIAPRIVPKLPTINHNFKPLPPLSDLEASKENEESTIRQKFVPKRPTFKPKFNQLTPYRDDVDEEIENELATENQGDFETGTEVTNDNDDSNFDGKNQEDENYDDTASQEFPSREGLRLPKFVPKSKFLKNKPQDKTTNRFVSSSFGANRKNVSKKVNNPELQLQTLVQTGNARNALFHKTRKANTPFVGIIRSSTAAASTTEQIVTTEEIVDAITITYEGERATEEQQRADDIQETSSQEPMQEKVVVQISKEENAKILHEDRTQKIQQQAKAEGQEQEMEERPKQIQHEMEQNQGQVSETTSEKQPETTEQSFTLHHIFAEAPNSTPLTTTEKETVVEFSTRDAKKLERLIEVNRIVEVSLKEGKFKHNLMVENEVTLGPILDRIGEINRVTVIKVVDPNGDLKLILKQNDTSNEAAKIEKAEIIEPLGKLTRYGEKLEAYLLPAKSQDLEDLKSKIEIYGKSIVNKYTPVTTKPPFSAEFSTIALEGLFKPFTTEDPSVEDKDEILETQNANYVNIRVLKDESDRGTVLSKPSDVESRARVVEITPETNSKIIKIAPITISFSSTHTVNES